MIPNGIVAVISGAILKIYDDIIDVPVYRSHFSDSTIETLKCLLIASITYMSINNMNIPFIVFIFMAVDQLFIDDKLLNTNFYNSGMVVTFILVLITFKPSHVTHILWFTLIIAFVGGFFEHTLFPEDYSIKKIIIRVLCVLFLLTFNDMILQHIVDSDIVLLTVGYFSMSVVNMIYLKYFQKPVTVKPVTVKPVTIKPVTIKPVTVKPVT